MYAGYVLIDKKIKQIEYDIEQLDKTFYCQNMFAHQEFDADLQQINTVGFNVENKVIDHVDSVQLKEQRIKKLKANKVKLQRYIETKPPHIQKYIIDRYVEGNKDISLDSDIEMELEEDSEKLYHQELREERLNKGEQQ